MQVREKEGGQGASHMDNSSGLFQGDGFILRTMPTSSHEVDTSDELEDEGKGALLESDGSQGGGWTSPSLFVSRRLPLIMWLHSIFLVDNSSCDLTIVVELVVDEGSNMYRPLRSIRVWRRMRCSAGLTLRQFQDRVLAPGVHRVPGKTCTFRF